MYFLFNYLLSLILILFFYLFGKNFERVFLKNNTVYKESIFKNYDLIAFFFGFFWYGNVLVLLNFFVPINYLFPILFISILFLERKAINTFLNINKYSFLMMFFLIPTIFNNTSSQDANMYHFYIQKLFQNEKINLGISNFHPHYGLGSIFDYVSSTLWIENNYAFIQLVNLIFIACFFNFLMSSVKLKNQFFTNIAIAVIILGFLDNFGFGGGRNGFLFIQEIGKFDSSYAIIFILSALLFYTVTLEKNFKSTNFYLLIYIVTFLSQIRPMGYLFFISIFIFLLFEKKIILLFKSTGFILLNAFWIIKNFLSTGCLVYPLGFTCFNGLQWGWPSIANKLSIDATLNNRNPIDKDQELYSLSWIKDYWLSENIDYLANFFISFFILFLFFVLLPKNSVEITNKYSYLNIFNLVLFTLSWFIFYPNYRFVSGILISIYLIFNINRISNSKINLKNSRIFHSLIIYLLVISGALIVRIDSYKIFINDLNQNVYSKFELTNPSLEKRINSYGYKSKEIHCFGELECSNALQRTNKRKLGSYSIYIPIKD